MAKAKTSKPETVGVSAKLREVFAWIEEAAEKAKRDAVAGKRKKLRTKGRELRSQELLETADELERIQRELNPLLNDLEIAADKLKAHWGHTGVEEIEGLFGKTLLSTSFELCLDSNAVQEGVGEGKWRTISKRVLDPQLALGESLTDEDLRTVLCKSVRVKKMKLSITPPSSRRPRSGEVSGGEDED
jgi:hypothetical protein